METIPEYHIVRALDEHAFAVYSSKGGRIGIYPSEKFAKRIADSADRHALRDWKKANRKGKGSVKP